VLREGFAARLTRANWSAIFTCGSPNWGRNRVESKPQNVHHHDCIACLPARLAGCRTRVAILAFSLLAVGGLILERLLSTMVGSGPSWLASWLVSWLPSHTLRLRGKNEFLEPRLGRVLLPGTALLNSPAVTFLGSAGAPAL
jgi:hypothetical protein